MWKLVFKPPLVALRSLDGYDAKLQMSPGLYHPDFPFFLFQLRQNGTQNGTSVGTEPEETRSRHYSWSRCVSPCVGAPIRSIITCLTWDFPRSTRVTSTTSPSSWFFWIAQLIPLFISPSIKNSKWPPGSWFQRWCRWRLTRVLWSRSLQTILNRHSFPNKKMISEAVSCKVAVELSPITCDVI